MLILQSLCFTWGYKFISKVRDSVESCGQESTWDFCVLFSVTLKTQSFPHRIFKLSDLSSTFLPHSLFHSFTCPLPLSFTFLHSVLCSSSLFTFADDENLCTIPFMILQDSLYLVSSQSRGSQLSKKTSRSSYIHIAGSTLYKACRIWWGMGRGW